MAKKSSRGKIEKTVKERGDGSKDEDNEGSKAHTPNKETSKRQKKLSRKEMLKIVQHYFTNGVNGYIYWNMILPPGGRSTWGWKQNSMITIDPETKEVIYNPEFYVMKHFSHVIAPGAVHLGLQGHWTGNAVAFENPDSELILIIENPFKEPRTLSFKDGGITFSIQLDACSINTLVVKG